jgi:hypothetical protein
LLRQSFKHFQRKEFPFLYSRSSTTFSVKEFSLATFIHFFKGFRAKKIEKKYSFKKKLKISLVGRGKKDPPSCSYVVGRWALDRALLGAT